MNSINHLREAQAGLQPRESLLSFIVRNIPNILCAQDMEGRFIFVNKTFMDLMKSKEEDFLGKTNLELFPKERAEHYTSTDNVVKQTRQVLSYEEIGPGGQNVLRIIKFPLMDEHGVMYGIGSLVATPVANGIFLESTPAQREYLTEIFSGATEPVVIVDSDGTIAVLNSAAGALLGYPSVELVGGPIQRIIPGYQHWRDQRLAGSKPNDDKQVLLDIVRRDGTRFPAVLSLITFRLTNDAKPWCVSTIRDFSEQKRLEEATAELARQLMHSQEEERRRIARELHDGSAQDLFAISLGLARLKTQLQDPSEAATALDEIRRVADSALRDIRSLSYLLHPPLLERGGLVPAVKLFLEGCEQRVEVKVESHIQDNLTRLPERAERAVFRTIQEALSNVARHSGSPIASVSLSESGGQIVVTVADKGHGFDAHTDVPVGKHRGVGLASMRERMREIGGTFSVESSDAGTTVTASVPINQNAKLDC